MDISIVIPTFNRKKLLYYTLRSLDKSLHKGIDLEVIVVDDHSDDGTFEFVKEEFPEVIIVKNEGKGGNLARNKGLSIARGTFINYLDSDDLIGKDFFLKKVEYLKEHPEIDACYGEYENFASNEDFSIDKVIFKHKYPILLSPDNANEHLINYLGGNFLPPNAIIWRKAFLMKCKGHDITLAVNQDVELFIRAILSRMRIIAIIDSTKAYIRDHLLDNRAGNPNATPHKWEQILELRKKIYVDLKALGYRAPVYYSTLSRYVFSRWKMIRHQYPEIAKKYLDFSKEVFWPVEIKGHFAYTALAKLIGPVAITKLKYFLLNRD